MGAIGGSGRRGGSEGVEEVESTEEVGGAEEGRRIGAPRRSSGNGGRVHCQSSNEGEANSTRRYSYTCLCVCVRGERRRRGKDTASLDKFNTTVKMCKCGVLGYAVLA